MAKCNSCGSDKAYMKERSVHWAKHPYHHVVCTNCGMSGKVCKTEIQAVEAWEMVNEVMKEEVAV